MFSIPRTTLGAHAVLPTTHAVNVTTDTYLNHGSASWKGKDKAQVMTEHPTPKYSPASSIFWERSSIGSNASSIYSNPHEPSTTQTSPPESSSNPPPCAAPRAYQTKTRVPLASKTGSLGPALQPPQTASLRLSLASFVSRLFGRSKTSREVSALSEAQDDDRKESERLDQLSARETFLPLSLPNKLLICRRMFLHPGEHGVMVGDNCSTLPLLVGYREGPRLRSKYRRVSLCLGNKWYATWTKPFLDASVDKHYITVSVCDYQVETAPEITVVKAWHTDNARPAYRFKVGIPDPFDYTATLQEGFEWRAGRDFYFVGSRQLHGSYLVQLSTLQVVATLEHRRPWARSTMCSGYVISFEGSGKDYGGLWKIIVFAIGLLVQ